MHHKDPFCTSKVLVSCARVCRVSVGHACYTTLASCTNDTTVRASYEELGTNVWCCSASALCQTRDNNAKSWNPAYLPLPRERCDRVSHGETKPKKQTRKTAYWSTIQAVAKIWMTSHFRLTTTRPTMMLHGGIPSLGSEATFCFKRFYV